MKTYHFTSPDNLTIEVREDGRSVMWVPTDPANRDYADILENNITVEPYAAPPAPVPTSVSDRQFAQALAERGIITWDMAEAWASRGDIPTPFLQVLSMIPDEMTVRRARMFLSSAQTYERHHPMSTFLGSQMGWSEADLDDLWRSASEL